MDCRVLTDNSVTAGEAGGSGAPAVTAGAAPEAGPPATVTPVLTACSAGISVRPNMRLLVVMTGQLPRPPALAGTDGQAIPPVSQGLHSFLVSGAGCSAGHEVTYAVAVTTLFFSHGATAVTVTVT